MTPDVLNRLLAARVERQAVALFTNLQTGTQRIVARAVADEALEKRFRFDQSGIVATDGGEEFCAIHSPPLRLVIIGAVHIAQGLIPIAQSAGYDITVIDPRGAFATGARFPGVTLLADWPQDVLPSMALDARTGFVALTHDPKIDDPALLLALRSEVFYVGALGSSKTQASRRERLAQQGLTGAQIAKIHGPIGLRIGAVGAVEIAISIMAEMTQCLRLGV
ncbi:MAG: XdhC family protein [Alphaproteobacteria bacterium]|nr:XdhC family protein [Alphaproteobacteria bacterium]